MWAHKDSHTCELLGCGNYPAPRSRSQNQLTMPLVCGLFPVVALTFPQWCPLSTSRAIRTYWEWACIPYQLHFRLSTSVRAKPKVRWQNWRVCHWALAFGAVIWNWVRNLNAFRCGMENTAAITFLWRRWISPGRFLQGMGLDKPTFRATNPFTGQHLDGMRRIRGLRRVITRRMQNVLESLSVSDHEPIFLEVPQW